MTGEVIDQAVSAVAACVWVNERGDDLVGRSDERAGAGVVEDELVGMPAIE